MSQRAVTDPPRTLWGWVFEALALLLTVTLVAGLVGVLWAMHMRERHVTVHRATCGDVVFVDGVDRWRFEPGFERCNDFVVGARWVIDVNDLGAVRPRRKE